MTASLARLVSLACALAAFLVLSLHVMAPVGERSEPIAHAAHGAMEPTGHSVGRDGLAACAVHCLVAAVLPAAIAPEHMPRRVLAPVLRIRLAGLVPEPLGPPPKPITST